MLLLLASVGALALCVALFPRHLPTPHDPKLVDLVFDNRPVIFAARLLLISAAFVLAVGGAFIVASTLVRTKNGDWLRRAGPFEVAETAVADLRDQVRLWKSATLDNQDELEDVRTQLQKARAVLDELKADTRPEGMEP